MAGIDSYIVLVVSITNAPRYLPRRLGLVVRAPHRLRRWWRSTNLGMGIGLTHHMERVADSIDPCPDNEYWYSLKLGAISSGEDDLSGFLFEWISRAYITIDPARQAVCLRLA